MSDKEMSDEEIFVSMPIVNDENNPTDEDVVACYNYASFLAKRVHEEMSDEEIFVSVPIVNDENNPTDSR